MKSTMIETGNSEINVEELKARIRAAVARREAEGRPSFARASAELFDLISKEDFPLEEWLGESAGEPELSRDLRLQPVFAPQANGYHVHDLLKYHDHQFVWNAYLALLKREPDEEGLRRHLEELRRGRVNKIDVLARLRYSPEGKRANVQIEGLRWPAIVRRAYRVPILGYLLELPVTLFRLPSFVHHQRKAEAHFAAQLDRLADGLNQANSVLAAERRHRAELIESFKRSIAEVASSQKEFALLQHRQLTALLQTRNGKSNTRENGRRISTGAGRDTDDLYAAFQKRFRGDSAETREHLRAYLALFDESKIGDEVLDVGCGNGTWIELLRERGIRARGVESNRTLAAAARAKGFELVEADAIRYLRTLPENSLSAVTAFHFVEHLALAALVDLIAEIHRVLKPGGLLVFETPNPKNLVVGACNFYSDPTHERPLFPESLEFMVTYSGFINARIEYLHPVKDSPFQGTGDGDRALNAWFFSPRDYAVIAEKPASA